MATIKSIILAVFLGFCTVAIAMSTPHRSRSGKKPPAGKSLDRGAPPPLDGGDFYCHTTQASPEIASANAAIEYFVSLDKQSCENKPYRCLNLLSTPGGGSADIRVWTCGPGVDSTECSNIAPILQEFINNCSKEFTKHDKNGTPSVVSRVGGVAWLSSAKSAWISLEGRQRN